MAQMGMDVEAVENVGRQLKQSAASVDTIVGTLDRTVSGLSSVWEGPDAQRFAQSWPTFRKSLLAAQASVAGLGQSALNNASEQREASGAKGPGGSSSEQLSTPPSVHPGLGSSSGTEHSQSFDAAGEQAAFDGRGGGPFGPGGDYAGQCTSWVNFRREQLVQEGLIPGPVPTRWHDGAFYPGSVSQDPTPYAVGSFANGGHTFVVESVGEGSPRTIAVSEMNVGQWTNKAALETTGLNHVSTATYTELSPGRWQKYVNGKPAEIDNLTFGA